MPLLLSPWTRLSLLLVILTAAGVGVLRYEPQRLLAEGWPEHLPIAVGVVLFAGVYGLCTAAFVPRPLLNLGAGVVFGTWFGLLAAVAGTVLGAGIAFGLGRLLGQDALRPWVRGKWLRLADGQLSEHGFRSVLAVRIFPGVPFAAANYCASISRCGWAPFLAATALGTVPNTAAYVVAGATASTPGSPVFLAAFGFIALSAVGAGVVAWRKRHRMTGAAEAALAPVERPVPVGAGSSAASARLPGA
ncbi:TVP38/TMEM64 family protein [Streptomyces sp. BI20]|uniref:TVP38/TMEM64 family protein n=1 Tax=Streptomyces sp. BI20 TaxID=3403460 RepID=UPI003C791A89